MTCVPRIFGPVAQNLTAAMLFLALLTGCGKVYQTGGGGAEGSAGADVDRTAQDSPANDSPANDSPAKDSPAKDSPANENTDSSQVVNVYSARHYNTDNQLYADFTAQSGVKVNVIEGKDSELLERIKSEGDRSPADIFLTVDAGRLWRAEKDGLFKPVQSKRLEAEIPANLRHPEGLWFGLSKRARIFVYNPDKVQVQELSTYEDLASPKWKGRICVRSSNSIYNQSLVAWMIEKDGAEKTEAWAKGLVNNFARQPEGGDVPQIQAVAEGSCQLAIVNHYYFARLLKSKDPKDQAIASQVSAYFPQPTHVNIGGAGVLEKSPHPENSVKFLEFLASPTGQAFFAEGNTEYPVVKGIQLDPVLEKFGTFDASPVNVSAYGQNNAQAIEIMDRVGWK